MGYINERAWFSSDERRWITRVRKLAAQYPDDVIIRRDPEHNDGCIDATLPASWLQIKPPVKQNLTQEQREELSRRMHAYLHDNSSVK